MNALWSAQNWHVQVPCLFPKVWPLQQTKVVRPTSAIQTLNAPWMMLGKNNALMFEVFLESKYGHINMENWKKPIFRVKKPTRLDPHQVPRRSKKTPRCPNLSGISDIHVIFLLPSLKRTASLLTPENPMVQKMIHFLFQGFGNYFQSKLAASFRIAFWKVSGIIIAVSSAGGSSWNVTPGIWDFFLALS